MAAGSNDGTRRSSRRAMVAGMGASAAAVAAAPLAAAQTPAADGGRVKVVFHVSDPGHYPYLISNLTNLLEARPDAALRVVVDGTAVYALSGGNDLVTKLGELAGRGVEMQVCPNALREHAVPEAAMPDWANTSTGGVIAMWEAQRDGFAYVKP